ncbi:phosphatase PAP2 family protein [Halobacteriales archaeon Cl-PHB]
MTLVQLLVRLVIIVGALIGLSTLTIVGRPRLRRLVANYQSRLRNGLPYLGLVGGVLAINSVAREVSPALSWLIGVNVTGTIYAIEGEFVAWVQSFASVELTAYFSFMYVYGYVFILSFPILAYLALEDQRYVRETCLAYSLNYVIGLLCYVVFIAYGPRNLMPELVESLMFTSWPESQLLTSQVNVNTNVFPSLHSSLAATVALLGVKTRRYYPAWTYLSAAFAASIVTATMYLGIHWGTDVVAGVALAVVSVWAAPGLDKRLRAKDWAAGRTGWIMDRLTVLADALADLGERRRS